MLDEIVGFFSQFNVNLGEVIMGLFCLGVIGKTFYEESKKILDNHTHHIEHSLKKREEFEALVNELSDTKTELDQMKSDLEDKINEVMEILPNYQSSYDQIEQTVHDMCDAIQAHSQAISALENKLTKIQQQIDVLFVTDTEYVRAYIIEGHSKYVKEQKQIDLLTLQNLENIYNRYLVEGGANDEFLSKLMRELRNLPTTREKKKES